MPEKITFLDAVAGCLLLSVVEAWRQRFGSEGWEICERLLDDLIRARENIFYVVGGDMREMG